MKKLSLLAATFVAAFASLPATAADGTINIEGEVTSNTCVINAADTNQTITLPKINVSQLAAQGASAAHSRFVIRISGCAGSATNARAFFEANGVNVDYTQNALKNLITTTDKAQGVGFALWNESNRQRIKIGTPGNDHGTSWIPVSGAGPVELGYEASYLRTTTAAIVPGKVRGQVQFSIDYN